MSTQNYCMVNAATNVCDNVTLWDGDTETWMPPDKYLMLVQATTPAKVWSRDPDTQAYVLVEVLGAGGIGFSWDGAILTTNEPAPALPLVTSAQPTVDGAQTL